MFINSQAYKSIYIHILGIGQAFVAVTETLTELARSYVRVSGFESFLHFQSQLLTIGINSGT